jgi:hypothetical protein
VRIVIGVGSLAHELEDLRREVDASRKEWARRETKGDPDIGAASDAVGPDARPDDSDRALADAIHEFAANAGRATRRLSSASQTSFSQGRWRLEVWREAMAAITNDAVVLQAPFEGLRADIRGVGDSVRGFLHNPLGAAGGKLLIPAVVALIRALRSHKTSPDTTAQ